MSNPGPHPDDALLRAFGYRIVERAAGKPAMWHLTGTRLVFSEQAALMDVRKALARKAEAQKQLRGGLECGGES